MKRKTSKLFGLGCFRRTTQYSAFSACPHSSFQPSRQAFLNSLLNVPLGLWMRLHATIWLGMKRLVPLGHRLKLFVPLGLQLKLFLPLGLKLKFFVPHGLKLKHFVPLDLRPKPSLPLGLRMKHSLHTLLSQTEHFRTPWFLKLLVPLF